MSKDSQEHGDIDARGVNPDIPCHTALCIKCNVFDICRFSSQEARQIREEQDNNEAEESKVERTIDNLPSCNSCAHNGTWDCIKCSSFDRYEQRK